MASPFERAVGNNHFRKSDACFHPPRVAGEARVKYLAEIFKEADDGGFHLQPLDDGIANDAIKTGIAEANVLLMMEEKRIHGGPSGKRLVLFLTTTTKRQNVRYFKRVLKKDGDIKGLCPLARALLVDFLQKLGQTIFGGQNGRLGMGG